MRSGTRISEESLSVIIRRTSEPRFRCAIVISSRVDKRAVRRNRMRRLVAESVSRLLPHVATGVDAVFLPGKTLPRTFREVFPRVDALLTDAGIRVS